MESALETTHVLNPSVVAKLEDVCLSFLEKGVDICLFKARRLGLETVCLKVLEKKGCDINFRDERGRTVLMESCESELEQLSLKLIELNVDVNQVDENQNTALM